MTLAVSVSEMTPEQLLKLPDGVRFELVDGQLVERQTGMESSQIAATIVFLLTALMRTKPLGLIFGADASYQCFADDPRKVRKPDVSFIRFGRLPGDRAPKGHCVIAPDLAVEVISPGDAYYEVEAKVQEYLGAGVKLIWVVNPPTRTVQIYRPKSSALGTGLVVDDTDSISDDEVIPGFNCGVSEFFV